MLRRIASKIQHSVGVGIESTYLYQLTRDDEIAEIVPSIAIRHEQLDKSGLDQLGALGPFDKAECEARLERGDACYGAFAADGLAHYSWVQRAGLHRIEAAGIDIAVVPSELWIFNCRTSDSHRGQGLYPATLCHLLREHFGEGYETAWIYTAEDNLASQRGIARVGFVQVDTLRAFRFGRYFRPLEHEQAS